MDIGYIKEKISFFLLLATIASLTVNIFFINLNLERNKVIKVVDGDSFNTKDRRRIRLISIDAPDKDKCMYEQAQEKLKELILNKRVKLKDTVMDSYGRLLANVLVKDKLVNKIMLEEGLARFTYVTNTYYDEMKQAQKRAKEKKLGIYSEKCRTTAARNNCMIKGNIRWGKKTYHLPDCPNYKQVIIDEAFGDRWFCNEATAIKEGFKKAKGCEKR